MRVRPIVTLLWNVNRKSWVPDRMVSCSTTRVMGHSHPNTAQFWNYTTVKGHDPSEGCAQPSAFTRNNLSFARRGGQLDDLKCRTTFSVGRVSAIDPLRELTRSPYSVADGKGIAMPLPQNPTPAFLASLPPPIFLAPPVFFFCLHVRLNLR